MISNDIIEIKVNSKNIEHYKSKGYKCELKDVIGVNPYDIIKGSHIKVDVECEVCGMKNVVKINRFWKNYNKGGYYGCYKCSHLKSKETCMERYGVENISQTKEERERMSKWMSSDEFREKSKKSMLDRYGVDRYNQTEEFSKLMFKNKEDRISKWEITNTETCLSKYGVSNYMKTNEFREKSKKSMLDRYGVEYSTQSEEIFNKIKETFIEKYGVDCPFKSEEIQIKIRNIFNHKYGSDNPFSNDEIIDKIKKTKIEMGLQSKDIPKYTKFKNKVIHQTRKNKQKMLEEWDGYDYYDDEYILDNFNLDPSSREYPTIDHKISVLYGYLNGMTIEEISNIENLCFTKRSINSSKGFRNHDYYISMLG